MLAAGKHYVYDYKGFALVISSNYSCGAAIISSCTYLYEGPCGPS